MSSAFSSRAGMLVFPTLKKRQTELFRTVPAPTALPDALDLLHGYVSCTRVAARGAARVSGPPRAQDRRAQGADDSAGL